MAINKNLKNVKNQISRFAIGIVFITVLFLSSFYTINSSVVVAAVGFSAPSGLFKIPSEPSAPPIVTPGALPTTDAGAAAQKSLGDKLKSIWNVIKEILKTSGKVAYKNALKNFLSRVAYDTATEIATGGTAKTPLFDTKFIGDFMTDVAETTLVDTLDVLLGSCKSGLPDDPATLIDESEEGTCKQTNLKSTPDKDESKELMQGCTPSCIGSYVQFDVCEPANLDLKLAFHYSLFNEFSGQSPHRPRCSLKDLQQNWADWNISLATNFDALSQMNFLDAMRSAFSPKETDVGIYLELDSSIRNSIKDKKTQELLDKVSRQGFKPVTEPITKAIKTPASVVGYSAQQLPANQAVYESTPTGDIVADAIGIFTNTLAAKLIDQLFKKGLTQGQQVQSTLAYNWVNQQAGILAQEQQFAELAEVQFTSGQERILDYLSSCLNPNSPGPTDCVIAPKLVTAIEQKMTVSQALAQGYLDGNLPVGWMAAGSEQSAQQPSYLSGYPYRSLVILRTQRILPVGWELAAWYARLENETRNLNYFVNCFEDDDPEHADDPAYPESCVDSDLGYNPYYHLVDPKWVLKAPEAYCGKKGFGYDITSEQWVCMEDNVAGTVPKTINITTWPRANATSNEPMLDAWPACDDIVYNFPDTPVRLVTRSTNYCADWQSCLLENDDGSCTGAYGYCLEEKELWRFEGESCPAQFASCQNLTRTADNIQFSFLDNTLLTCDESEAGCSWYADTQERLGSPTFTLAWLTEETDSRIYLNDQAKNQTCTVNDIGCTKVAMLKPAETESGNNMIFNSGFDGVDPLDDSIPTDWEFIQYDPGNDMEYTQEVRTEDSNSVLYMEAISGFGEGDWTGAVTEGFIPIDARFTYQLSFSYIAEGVYSGSGGQKASFNLDSFYRDALGDMVSLGTVEMDNWFVPEAWTTKDITIGQAGSGADKQFIPGTEFLKLVIRGPRKQGDSSIDGWIKFDNINFAVIESPVVAHNMEDFSYATTTYNPDYSQDANAYQHLKVAPEYLKCDGYNDIIFSVTSSEVCFDNSNYWREDKEYCVASGDILCENYTAYCESEEIGCQGYLPLTGGPEVPAKTSAGDVCPAECVGYDNFLQSATYFEDVECRLITNQDDCVSQECDWNSSGYCQAYETAQAYMIPQTANQCSVSNIGCDEFTNLDELAKGGESLEYFTYLRQCISPNNSNISYYYTWEGSDTSGYQLKKWEFLKSSAVLPGEVGYAPCTNIAIGAEECLDGELGYAPQVCAQAAIEAGDYNCRDFFNAQNNHYYRFQDKTIIASNSCHPYRRTATGQIYNADPVEGDSCPQSANGCKEYKGNSGNNVRNVLVDDFEEGTTGLWEDSYSCPNNGLSISNESVVQGGHSLLVALNNNIAAYPVTDIVTPGKQYTLSFWAKKAPGITKSSPLLLCNSSQGGELNYNPINHLASLFSGKAMAQTSANILYFSQTISNEWQSYQTGEPVELIEGQGGEIQLRLEILSLASNVGYYIDNIILQEYTDNYYVIEDSWQTPEICATPYLNSQAGCQQYQDRNYDTHYLKSFDYICSDTAIGCQAFITTQNSSAYQGEHVYGSFECDETVGIIEADGDCVIRGQTVCQVLSGQDSCDYTSADLSNNSAVVPNDEIIYAVDDPEMICTEQGCSRLGKVELNKQKDFTDADYAVSSETVYLVNNPDDYGDTLCGPSGEFCQKYSGGASSSFYYYYDPVGAPSTAGETSHTCYYDAGANVWKVSGSADICPSNQFHAFSGRSYLPRYFDYGYQNWVGLCEADNATCTEYRDPEDPYFDSAAECDSTISHQLAGVCSAEESGYLEFGYCIMEINGLEHKVCEVAAGEDECEYTAYEWICDLGHTAGVGGEDCKIPDPNGIKACYVESGLSTCAYSLVCDSYYYKANTVDYDAGDCDGLVDREKGCKLFNDTGDSVLNFNADPVNTPDGAVPASCSGTTVTLPDDCDSNILLKVRKDRECKEWLQCGSSFQLTSGEDVCLDLVKCAGVDPNNPSVCNNVITEQDPDELTINLTNSATRADEVNSIRYLSGYSHAGAQWSGTKKVEGYFSPENMSQPGLKIDIVNPGFEDNFISMAPGWSDCNATNNILSPLCSPLCNFQIVSDVVHSGQYSAKLNMPSDVNASWCDFSAIGDTAMPASGNAYPIDPDQRYNLSFWVKSSDGLQDVAAGFAWFDVNGGLCDDTNQYCNSNTPAYMQSTDGWSLNTFTQIPTEWQKYTVTFGPTGGGSIVDREIPTGAKYIRIWLLGPKVNTTNGQPGNVWYDDFSIEPALEVRDNTILSKDCRLFPQSNSLSCDYQDVVHYTGWNGYCLEPDPFVGYNPNPQDPKNTQQCLQWYPVDSVAGDPLSVFSVENVGWDDGNDIYYCAQSEGYFELKKDISSGTVANGTKFNAGSLSNGYKVQSHIHERDRISDDCEGGAFSNNNNISLCLDESYDGKDNKRQYCWWDDVLWQSVCNTATGSGLYGANYAFDSTYSSDYYINLNNIFGIYIDKVASDGGWQNGSDGFMVLNNTSALTGYIQYEKIDMFDGEGCMFFAWFNNNNGDLKGIKVYCDDNDEHGYGRYDIYYYMKEPCTTIAQVVDNTGNNKVWLSRYDNGWTSGQGNILGYGSGIMYGAFGKTGAPFSWNNVPLMVYHDGNLSGYDASPWPMSTENSMPSLDAVEHGRMCVTGDDIGEQCSTSDDGTSDDCTNGICMGIGKYCFDPDTNITDGSPCNADNYCPAVDFTDCRAIGSTSPYLNSINLSNVNKTQAIQRIQNLFAKVYGVWEWNDSSYEETTLSYTNLDISNDPANATNPVISNIKVNNTSGGDVEVPANSGLVNLDFNTTLNLDQLPLMGIYINWKDGESLSENNLNTNHQPGSNNPHRATHTYSCVLNGAGTACVSCPGSGNVTPTVAGTCEYPGPSINVKDNWGWCMSNYAGDGACSTSNGTSYAGKIIVSP